MRLSFSISCVASAVLGGSLFFAAPAQAKPSWQLVYSEPNSGNAILGLSAVDGSSAWAVGISQGMGSSSPIGLRTQNGSSWSPMPLPPAGMFTFFTRLAFVDAQRGWLAGVSVSISGEQAILWRSEDGGLSWSEVAQPGAVLEQLQALPSGELYAVGGQLLVRSLDGTGVEPIAMPVAPEATVRSVHMLNPSCGYAVAASAGISTVLWSGDSGTSWQARAEGLPSDLKRLWFVDADRGWAAGVEGDRGVVARTSDGGRSFSNASIPDHPAILGGESAPVTSCEAVRFFDDLRGVALCLACTADCDVPEGNPSYLTVLARSEDGGHSWQMDPDYEPVMNAPPFGELMKFSGMLAMTFPDPNNGFVAGQNNLILRYSASSPEPTGWGPASCESGGGDNGTGGAGSTSAGSGAEDDGGCGCRVAGRGSTGGAGGAMGLLALIACGRRRRAG